MLSTVHCQGVPMGLLPLNTHRAAAPSQLWHSKNKLPQKHSQNVSLPGRSFPLLTACPGTPRDIPNRTWCTFPRQEYSTVVSLTTDLARHYSGVNIPVLYFATWPGQDPSFLGLLAHGELWSVRILLPNDFLHWPQQLNSWLVFNQIPVSVQYYTDA